MLSVANLVDLARADPVAELEDLTSRLPPNKCLAGIPEGISWHGAIWARPPEISAALNRPGRRGTTSRTSGFAVLGDLYSYDAENARRAPQPPLEGDRPRRLPTASCPRHSASRNRMSDPLISRAYGELVDDWIFGHMPTEWLDPNWHYQRLLTTNCHRCARARRVLRAFLFAGSRSSARQGV